MALNALNNTPKLAECTQISFLGAFMNAAQLGLDNGGYGFEVMSRADTDSFAAKYSKGISSAYSHQICRRWREDIIDVEEGDVIETTKQ